MNGDPEDIQAIKARIRADLQALVEAESPQYPFPAFDRPMVHRTYDRNDPLEADLFEVLKRGGLELVGPYLAHAAQHDSDVFMRPARRIAVIHDIFEFLQNLWFSTGTIPHPYARMMNSDPAMKQLRSILHSAARSHCSSKQGAGTANQRGMVSYTVHGKGNPSNEDSNVALLERIAAKQKITIGTWAADHHLGRSTVFDWRAGRSAGASLKGKVSEEKAAEIESAIRKDAEALGLIARTSSD